MAMLKDTGGNVCYAIPYCDCGLTGGCEKCQPNVNWVPRDEYPSDTLFPEPHESDFLDPALRAFYIKKGYITGEIA